MGLNLVGCADLVVVSSPSQNRRSCDYNLWVTYEYQVSDRQKFLIIIAVKSQGI